MKTHLRTKIGAALVALTFGLAAAIVAVPAAASAHTGNLKAAVACTDSTGEAVVTWTLTNDWDQVVTVTASNNASIKVGATVAAAKGGVSATRSVTQKIPAPAAGVTATATLELTWADKTKQQLDPVSKTVDNTCTAPIDKCITAVWTIPNGDSTNGHAFDVPQKLWKYESADCGDLTHPVPPTTCGTAYQVDSYNDNATTTKLLQGGVLYNSHNPAESVYNGQWTFVQNPACKDASASASVDPATCTSPGQVHFEITNATWDDANDITDGSRTATATAKHLFDDGKSTTTVTYTIPSKLDPTDADCVKKDATAAVSVDPATCTAPGTPHFTIENATWDDAYDKTDGTRTATAVSGHVFDDGKTTATVKYTVPSKLDPADAACVTKDATAAATATPASCTAPSGAGFTIEHATWDDAYDKTDGSRTATAVAGHVFSDGTAKATVTYTVAPKIPSTDSACAVTPPQTPPSTTPPVVTPPVITPPVVSPPVVPATDTTPEVKAPRSEKPETTKRVEAPTVKAPTTGNPRVLASTGFNDSTPIAGELALAALAIGATLVAIGAVRRRRADAE